MVGSNSSSDSTLAHWLALERIPRVGPVTISRLIEGFGSPEAALDADAEEIQVRTAVSESLAHDIADCSPDWSGIERDIDLLGRLGARVLTRWDDGYPPNITEIYDPPALLFVRGEIVPEDSRAVGIVGTRTPTRYGLEMTESLTRDLVRAGVTVISGVARGIDTACHKAALKEGGRTIGVLGCGIDVTYPRENKGLIEEISSSGAVISEFRPGTAPLATNFYRRNRIISGLSRGALVVEADMKSGSLITTKHAIDQNRDVFAVPGNIMSRFSRGPHHLIKQGAKLVETVNDILEGLFEPIHVEPPAPAAATPELSEVARRALEAVDPDPAPIDVIGQALGMDAGTLSGALLELELSGLVTQHPGKMFARVVRRQGTC